MTTPERQIARGTLISAAKQIGEKLELALRDPDAMNVMLSREEALIAIGLLAGAAEALGNESSSHGGEIPLPSDMPR